MRKLTAIIAMMLVVTIGGVYAAWNYAQGAVSKVDAYLDGVTKITEKVVTTAKGNISVNSENLSITIDDANNDHVAELKVEGYITVTFTPNEGADEVVDQNGIKMKYQLSNTGLLYNEDAIFAYSSDEVVMNNGNAAKSVTIQASELGITLKNSVELHTVAEYEADIKAKIKERKTADSDRKLEEDLLNIVLEKTTVEIPDCMIQTEIDGYVRDYDYRLQMQGGSLDLYYKYTGQTEEQLRESFKAGAEKQVKTRLALEYIAKTENITATEEEIEAEYAKIASGYAVEIEKVKTSIPVSGITEDVVLRKAVEFVKENANVK